MSNRKQKEVAVQSPATRIVAITRTVHIQREGRVTVQVPAHWDDDEIEEWLSENGIPFDEEEDDEEVEYSIEKSMSDTFDATAMARLDQDEE